MSAMNMIEFMKKYGYEINERFYPSNHEMPICEIAINDVAQLHKLLFILPSKYYSTGLNANVCRSLISMKWDDATIVNEWHKFMKQDRYHTFRKSVEMWYEISDQSKNIITFKNLCRYCFLTNETEYMKLCNNPIENDNDRKSDWMKGPSYRPQKNVSTVIDDDLVSVISYNGEHEIEENSENDWMKKPRKIDLENDWMKKTMTNLRSIDNLSFPPTNSPRSHSTNSPQSIGMEDKYLDVFPMLNYIKNVWASGDDKLYNYIILWLSNILKTPNRWKPILIIYGDRNKSEFRKFLLDVVKNSVYINNSRTLCRRYDNPQCNKNLVIMENANSIDKIKRRNISYEIRGQAAMKIKNNNNYLIFSSKSVSLKKIQKKHKYICVDKTQIHDFPVVDAGIFRQYLMK